MYTSISHCVKTNYPCLYVKLTKDAGCPNFNFIHQTKKRDIFRLYWILSDVVKRPRKTFLSLEEVSWIVEWSNTMHVDRSSYTVLAGDVFVRGTALQQTK